MIKKYIFACLIISMIFSPLASQKKNTAPAVSPKTTTTTKSPEAKDAVDKLKRNPNPKKNEPVVVYNEDFVKGEELFQLNKPEEAIAYFEKSLESENIDPKVYVYLGVCYYQIEQYDKSLAVCVQGLTKEGTDKKILAYNAGNTCYALGNYMRADASYALALREDSSYAPAVLNRANAQLKLDRLGDARSNYIRYLELEPETPQKERIEIIIRLLEDEITLRANQKPERINPDSFVENEGMEIASPLEKVFEELPIDEAAAVLASELVKEDVKAPELPEVISEKNLGEKVTLDGEKAEDEGNDADSYSPVQKENTSLASEKSLPAERIELPELSSIPAQSQQKKNAGIGDIQKNSSEKIAARELEIPLENSDVKSENKSQSERVYDSEEQARFAEENRRALEAEKTRLAEEARIALEAEKARLAEEAQKKLDAEAARLAAEEAEKRRIEEMRLALEVEKARLAEESRIALEAEKARLAEEARKSLELEKARLEAEEAKRALEAERARLIEEAKRASEAEQARIAAQEAERKRAEEENRRALEAEKSRLALEAEKARLAEEARRQIEAEKARIAAEEEKKALEAERARIAEEQRKIEEARIAEEKRKAEEEQKAEEARLAEERRLAEEAKKAEEEQKAAEEAQRAAEEKKAEEARKAEKERQEKLASWPKAKASLVAEGAENFTPDGDGHNDTVIFRPSVEYLEDSPESWTLTILDPHGNLFRTVQGNGELPASIEWGGTSESGEVALSKNTYTARLSVFPSTRDRQRLGPNSIEAGCEIHTGLLLEVIVPGHEWKMVVNSINFVPNGGLDGKLTSEQKKSNFQTLDEIAKEIKEHPGAKIVIIEGYANNISGTEKENREELMPLSQLRADAIVQELIKRGVNPDVLQATGMGGANPLASRDDHDNWWKNRRVEFRIKQ
ncbi:MAG: OmpA family protein [Treponema sp.]|uniref:OmpA family protein n=1 Tax=Treponema sp. TaxID=166 RepID=UPI0025DC38EE|nr:OmpA family protein [Treponema sp.]MBQ9281644.1 OmpA family protein [Treponema sp.]